MEIKDKIVPLLQEQFPETNFEVTDFRGDLKIKFDASLIVPVGNFLKQHDELKFNMCEDVTAVDWATKKKRFTIIYHIYSLENKFRLRLACDVEENHPHIESVVPVWKSANWYERETYDMYGIKFDNHPDLRRMYMPEEYEYYPLRKEYPLMGIPGDLTLPKK
ncbi:MAG: NADH-quinone oxidoreductase subunit C [Ignavibacteriales bacterium]|jgi:NADH-quinone oxidoreductase subunit C|nr:NADH-quinone oxidoreductase subunit C [Ignavibacteriales bacterium]MBK8660365.1 NADH-quinone oxidoreductase subunit C [Ignavibacteriales bacterium]MBP7542578.1 NADH-quinone oxidoreductase subunit C [Ignavibacteriaceae bacterium]MBP9123747.1 NADH-quinone oxidoreductase subunit C [Ignavibacteriaceae bacterium]MCC6637899.1 NADH-quinone oxidoreductase subunit C [Ignavibacteriaceae bacterium]